MVLIAVAGGTSPTLGRSIITAISETTSNTPIILTRCSPHAPKTKYNTPTRQVDYTSHTSLVAALKDVHTLISVLKIPGPEWAAYQINLLRAAEEAGVKRFAPSEFENGPDADGGVDVLAGKVSVWAECVRSERVECGRFSGGMFMNYLALGAPFPTATLKDEVTQHLDDMTIIWDIANRSVEMPVKSDGTAPRITLTDIRDIGRFVAAACELPLGQWEESMEMVGETINADQVTDIIEEVSGLRFERRTVDRGTLQKRVDGIEGLGRTREEIVAKMVSQISVMMINDREGQTVMRPVVNRLCPGVRPRSVREFVERCWKDG